MKKEKIERERGKNGDGKTHSHLEAQLHQVNVARFLKTMTIYERARHTHTRPVTERHDAVFILYSLSSSSPFCFSILLCAVFKNTKNSGGDRDRNRVSNDA